MDDEIKNIPGSSLNYTFRMHDPRIGRFFAVDPLAISYPYYTPYSFSGNKVIAFGEIEGLEEGWVIHGEKIVHAEGPTEEVMNSFATKELAQAAQSIGMKTPQMMDTYMSFMERLKSLPTTPYTPETITDNGLLAQANKTRHSNPGLTISLGVIQGFQEAPMVTLPEIAFAKLGTAYKTWKASKFATQAIKNADNLIQPEFINNADEAFDIYMAAQKKAVANVNNSGKTVLGSYPEYIQMAQKNGNSYFDVGSLWDDMVRNGQNKWSINKVFLDKIAAKGDEVIITLGKNADGTIKSQGEYLKKEIDYLIKEKGYIWKNTKKNILIPKPKG